MQIVLTELKYKSSDYLESTQSLLYHWQVLALKR
jgi:hypothetical protein